MKLRHPLYWVLAGFVMLFSDSISTSIIQHKNIQKGAAHVIYFNPRLEYRRMKKSALYNVSCSETCMNGGVCHMSQGQAKCICRLGFSGSSCEDAILDLNCNKYNMEIKLLRNVLHELKVNESLLHLANPKCKMMSFTRLHASIVLTSQNHSFCGTTVKVNGSHLIYSNELTSGTNENVPRVPGSLITRSPAIRMQLFCAYKYDGIVSLPYSLQSTYSLVTVVVKERIFNVSMRLYPTSDFIQQNEWLPVISPSQNIFVQLQVDEPDPQNYYSLRVEDCWATPTDNHAHDVRYPIISSGYPNDTTVQMIDTFDNALVHFGVQMFQFINYSEAYLHCRVFLCPPNSSSVYCNRSEPYTVRRRRYLEGDYNKILSCGPVRLMRTTVSSVGTPESVLQEAYI
ncbi:hypothetical protein GDO86_008099 [Hymenochirus boettgeri]|uniref:Uncharacterized protein n=1 Tax=Hymenochirus boettgeri TaxID=247094 RepID=A0A8T2J1H4_9PIPI|nr:hypothetical protein GDO86_008099 [Hymenochirus boettgeri]